MLLSPNVKECLQSLDGDEASIWETIFDDLINHGRINVFDGADLAILCKHISSRDQEREDFW